jgi:hypothetical protein
MPSVVSPPPAREESPSRRNNAAVEVSAVEQGVTAAVPVPKAESSSPEDNAVATMILALEKMAPDGQFRPKAELQQASMESTPVRRNSTWNSRGTSRSQDDDDAFQDIDDATRAEQRRAKSTPKVRFADKAEHRSPKKGSPKKGSPKKGSPKKGSPKKGSPKKGGDVVSLAAIAKRSKAKRMKQREGAPSPSLSDSETDLMRTKVVQAAGEVSGGSTEGLASWAPLSKHGSRPPSRPHLYADALFAEDGNSADDDYSVRSDPTNGSSIDSSYNVAPKGDDIFDSLMDMVASPFNMSMDEDTSLPAPTEDEATVEEYMDDESFSVKQGETSPAGHVFCLDNEAAEASASCQLQGPDVFSDLSSALNFQEDDPEAPLPSPTTTTFSQRDTKEETSKGYLSDFSSVFSLDRVFSTDVTDLECGALGKDPKGDEDAKAKTTEAATAPTQPSDAPGEETVGSILLSPYKSLELAAAAMANVTQQCEDESKKLFLPLPSFHNTPVPATAPSPAPERETPVDAELERVHQSKKDSDALKRKHSKGGDVDVDVGYSPSTIDTADYPSDDDDTEASESSGFQGLPNSPFLYTLRSVMKSPVAFSKSFGSYTGASTPTQEMKADAAQAKVEAAKDDKNVVLETVLSTIRMSLSMMAGDHTDEAEKVEGETETGVKEETKPEDGNGGNRSSRPFDQVLSSFQEAVDCQKEDPDKEKTEEGDKTEGDKNAYFLSNLSKSFSFWNKEDGPTTTTTTAATMDTADDASQKAYSPCPDTFSFLRTNKSMSTAKNTASIEEQAPAPAIEDQASVLPRPVDLAKIKTNIYVTTKGASLTYGPDSRHRSETSLTKNVSVAKDTAVAKDASIAKDASLTKNPSVGEHTSLSKNSSYGKEEPASVHVLHLTFSNDASETASSVPESPKYKMPSRSPGRVVKSLQQPRKTKEEKLCEENEKEPPLRPTTSPGGSVTSLLTPMRPTRHTKPMPPEEFHAEDKMLERIMTPPRPTRRLLLDSLIEEKGEKEEKSFSSKSPVSDTWADFDADTTADSWEDFKGGAFFKNAWPEEEKTTPLETRITVEEEHFTITSRSSSFAKLEGKSKSLPPASPVSTKDPAVYGQSSPEFRSFGRRSLIQDLNGTTTAEI